VSQASAEDNEFTGENAVIGTRTPNLTREKKANFAANPLPFETLRFNKTARNLE